MDAVRWFITAGHKDVNKPDKNGCTALFYAIQKNHVVIVKDLIKAGAGMLRANKLHELKDRSQGVEGRMVHVVISIRSIRFTNTSARRIYPVAFSSAIKIVICFSGLDDPALFL